MNNWQLIAVVLVLLLCAIWIGQRVYSFFYRVKKNVNPCDSCISGCELKELMDKKRTACKSNQKEEKKNCCG